MIPTRFIQNRWAMVPVVMLSFTVISAATILTLSFQNSNVTAVEPDYYRKAISWDSYRQQLERNGALGWVVSPTFVPGKNDPHLARLELTVKDKYGVAIQHAEVRAECIPIHEANSRVVVELQETSSGVYSGDIPLRVDGWWEIRSTIQCKERMYCDRFRRLLAFDEPMMKELVDLKGLHAPIDAGKATHPRQENSREQETPPMKEGSSP